MDSRNHPKNAGRESLFDLEVGADYLVQGRYAATYETFKDSNTRITLTEVLIREYRVDISYEEIPVVGFAQHINSVRKAEGMNYVKLKEGEISYWIGQLEEYESVNTPGVKRRSLKLKRDVGIVDEISAIETRLGNMNSLLESIKNSELETRLNKTSKMIQRVTDILSHYQFVPHISLGEAQARLNAINGAFSKLVAFSRSNEQVTESVEMALSV